MSQTVKPILFRADKKIDRTSSPNGCWLWTAFADKKGYGRIWSFQKKKPVLAYRMMYEYLNGDIPLGKELDHLCRTPRCVNPSHLEIVTTRENMLRGVSPCANHAHKTHCKRGHPFAGENLLIVKNGRACLACRKLNWKEWSAKKRMEKT